MKMTATDINQIIKDADETLSLRPSFILSVRHILVILLSAVLGLSLQLFTTGILAEISLTWPGSLDKYNAMIENSFSASLGAARLISVILVAPVVEELFFRALGIWIIFSALPGKSRSFRLIFSTVFTSLIFGLYHGNLVQFIYAFAVGIIFAAIDLKTGSVYPSIAAHIAVNASAYLNLPYLYNTKETAALVAAVSLILVCLFICLIFRCQNPKQPESHEVS